MSGILFLGFGSKVKFSDKYRVSWVPQIKLPKDYSLNNYNAIIINLNAFRVVTNEFTEKFIGKIHDFLQKRRIIICITGHSQEFYNSGLSSLLNLRHETIQSSDMEISTNNPIAIENLFQKHLEEILYAVDFYGLPSHTQILSKNFRRNVVSFLLDYACGKIIVVPPVFPILYGSKSFTEEKIKGEYLEGLIHVALSFVDLSEERPDWLNKIKIFDEKEVEKEYYTLKSTLSKYYKIKCILNDSGKTLTKKVNKIFKELGFQTKEKEIEGKEDILIKLGDSEGVIECSGSNGYFNIEDLDQLIRYITRTWKKGIFVGNAFKQIEPKKRKVEKAFTDEVKKTANKLDICLITVPQLFKLYLDIRKNPELKASYCKKIMKCKEKFFFN